MTVFVGPSNTGKSYLAILLYAISKGWTDADNFIDSRRVNDYFDHLSILRSGLQAMPPDDIVDKDKLFSERFKEDIWMYDIENAPRDFERIINSMNLEWASFASHAISNSISAFFDVGEIKELTTHNLFSQSEPRFELSSCAIGADWNIRFIGDQLHVIADAIVLNIPDSIVLWLTTDSDDSNSALNNSSMSLFLHSINDSFRTPFSALDDVTYFPAARSGIIASHRTLNRNLVASVSRSRLNREPTVPYNRIINDFLENLLRVGERVTNPDHGAVQVAETLEQSLLNGSIRAKESQYGPPDFVYSQDEYTIPLSRSSSMVTELAPIVLFLKHFLRKGELLIIEEPEAHLHPAAQQKFAAALALMVRNGFRVLITTHSHYMVEQISDFVGASGLSPEKRRELLRLGPVLGEQDIYLNEDEVGVYGFDNSSGGTIVKEIPYDENFAYAPSDHIEAMTEQFNRNVGIMRAQRNGYSSNGHDGS